MNLNNKLRGRYFTPTGLISGEIAASSNGTLISLPEVDGVFYKLISLWSANNTTRVSDLTLTVDNVNIHTNDQLCGYTTSGSNATSQNTFIVASCYTGDSNVNGQDRIYHEILCKSFSLTAASSTNLPIIYAYEIGNITA